MFNREYHVRANRRARAKLQGEQLELADPRRGRPTRIRVLERCGQLRLNLQPETAKLSKLRNLAIRQEDPEAFDDALEMTFPTRPPSDDELYAEFCRLFPVDLVN